MCGLQPFWADQWSNLHPSYQSYRTYLIMDSMRGDPAIEPFQSESDRSWVWNRPNINPSYQSYRTYLIMDSARGDPAIEPFFSRSQIDLIVWAWEAAAMIPGFATRLDGSSTAMSKPPRLSSSTTAPQHHITKAILPCLKDKKDSAGRHCTAVIDLGKQNHSKSKSRNCRK